MAFCSDVFGAGLTDWAEKHGQVGTDEILMAGGLAPGPWAHGRVPFPVSGGRVPFPCQIPVPRGFT